VNIDDVRAFVAAVDTGSVAKAALFLHLTQPAITRRIQRLEASLGITLLDRDSKPAKPTRAGEAAYQRCIAVLRATEALARETRGTVAAGPLRVGVTLALSEAVLAPAIEAVQARSPDVALHLIAERSAMLRKQVAEGQLDAAVVATLADRPIDDSRAVALGTEQVLVVAARDSALPSRLKLTELAGTKWIINPNGCGFRAQLERALADKGFILDVIAETWGAALQLALVARGIGVGLIPERLMVESPYRDRVRVVTVEDFAPALTVWMVTSGQLGPFDAAVEFIAATVREFLADPPTDPLHVAKTARRRRLATAN
jgi:DNA-binding transcriptional LysR family regulator